MQPTQTFDNFPEFGNASQKSKPNDAKYAAGFLPQEVLPAEWHNWFLNGATKGITALNTGVASIEAEINTVLNSRSETPDASQTNQLLTVLNKIKSEAVLAAHPVGSLYWTSSNENPAITFGGGTWVQIKDKFVLAAGDTYTNGATGGSATVTLTSENMPSHSHSGTTGGNSRGHTHGMNHHHNYSGNTGSMSGDEYARFNAGVANVLNHNGTFEGRASNDAVSSANTLGTDGGKTTRIVRLNLSHYHSYSGWTGDSYTTSNNWTTRNDTDGESQNHTHDFSTSSAYGNPNDSGNATAHDNMPPYIVKFCWERTA